MLATIALVDTAPPLTIALGLTPTTATKLAGGNHTVTAKAESTGGTAVPGAPVTFKILTGPNAGKTLTGTTDANGLASFTYIDANGLGGKDTIQATIGALSSNIVEMNWTPPNSPPVAVGDSFTTNEDTSLNLAAPGVTSNDSDPDHDSIMVILVSGVSHGKLVLNADGSFAYTPNANYNGPDAFTYKLNDGKADGNTVTASITVVPVNDPPVAIAKDITINAGASCRNPADINYGSYDVDGDALTITQTPAGPYPLGTTTVTLTVRDPSGATSTATGKVTVLDVLPPFTAVLSRLPAANAAGWNNANVVVKLVATDGCSAVKDVVISLAGVQTGTTTTLSSAATVTISTEGTTTLTYFAHDVFGNMEAPQTLVVKLDKTAPEAYNQFDTATKTAQVFGRDALSGAPATPMVPACSPALWTADDNDGDDDDGDHRAHTCTFTIADRAGNALLLVEKVKELSGDDDGRTLKVHVLSTQYNSGPVTTPPFNKGLFVWSLDKAQTLKEFTQTMVIGKGDDKQKVTATFDSKKNQTTIDVKDGKPAKVVKSGLILLRLATNKGVLSIEY